MMCLRELSHLTHHDYLQILYTVVPEGEVMTESSGWEKVNLQSIVGRGHTGHNLGPYESFTPHVWWTLVTLKRF